MRCRHHPNHSGIGVCSFCLRQRLDTLATTPTGPDHFSLGHAKPGSEFISPPSLPCPRSRNHSNVNSFANLYSSRRKVGPSAPSTERLSSRNSPLFSTIFQSKEVKENNLEKHKTSVSWLHLFSYRRGLKNKKTKNGNEDVMQRPQPCKLGGSDSGVSVDGCVLSGLESEYCSTVSSGWGWSPSPIRRTTAEHRGHRLRGLAGFAVCLTPLARASPKRT